MRKLLLGTIGLAIVGSGFAELPVEPLPNVARLPAQYPETWLFALDANFQTLLAGKVIIVDVAADSREYKGAIGAAQFATFAESSVRSELYVGETFYSRGTVGERTDVVTIYDKSSLDKIGEVVLPGGKRGQFVTNRYGMQLVGGDRYLLVFNFTPGSSVTIVDIEARQVLNEIKIPGCSMVYPGGPRGFSSLCSDGSMLSVQFDEQGKELARHAIEPFFDVDDDPVFDKPAYIDEVAYFVSYKGRVYPVDLSGDTPRPQSAWSLVDDKVQAANWRPSGWQVIASDGKDELYVIMQPNGFEGSHKSGGEHIWVASAKARGVVRRFDTEKAAFSLEFVAGAAPMLVSTNVDMWLDVYTRGGERLRSISLGDSAMPLALYRKR